MHSLQAADAIKAMLSPTATVVRNGQRDTIDADQLVPGDVVVIKSGDKVPADLRLLKCSNLQVRVCYSVFIACCSNRGGDQAG
jgi:P-type E1-E2 ATPase